MPKSIDQIFGSTSSKPKTIDEIFSSPIQPADPNVNMGNFRQLDQQSLPPNLTIGPTQRNLNLLQNPAQQMFTESQKLPVEPPKWGLGKLQQNDPIQKWIDNSPVGSFFNRISQQGNNVAFNGGENIPGQTLSDTGNATANKVADFLGYGGLFMNPAAGLEKLGATAASKVLPKIGTKTDKLLQGAIGGATLGAGFGAQQASTKSLGNPDYTAGQVAKDIGMNALMFGGGDLALRGLGMGAKAVADKAGITQWAKNLFERMGKDPAALDIPETSSTRTQFPSTLKAIDQKQQAIDGLNKGIEAAQNYVGHNDILAPYPKETTLDQAFADIKANTDVDLLKLINNVEAVQVKPLSTQLQNAADVSRLGRAAGVFDSKPLTGKTLTELKPPELPMPAKEPFIGPKSSEPLAQKEVVATAEPSVKSELVAAKPAKEEPAKVFQDAGVDPAQWKDKAKPFLVRETMDRNFEDIMGKDAPAMKKAYLGPIKKNEADRIRFINQERDSVKNLNIKFNSKDDELVQKFGEGLIDENQLKQLTPNWKQVKSAAETMRAKYDELLTTVNKVLERNGYDPIPKRANYFPHYEEIDNILSKTLGVKLEDFTLPTDINGLTADLKPGKNFFSNALRRRGEKTDYGFIQGFDKYIEGVSKLIYHTDDIKRLRGLEKGIRSQFEGTTHLSNFVSNLLEYTNNLAGKKSRIDRASEEIVGRKIYTTADSLRKKVGANMIGGSISSAVTNFIPLTQALATTEKTAFVKGMLQTISNVGKNDGFVQSSDFLTKRVGSDPLAMNLWDKAIDKAGWLFKVVDNFVSQTIVRGKYNEFIDKGFAPEQAMKQADDWAAKIIADRSLGSMPTLFNSRTLGFFTQFQLEVNNQISFMAKDIPRNFNKVGAASALAQVFFYSYLFNNIYEKAMGRRPAFDPIGIAQKAYEDYTNPNLQKKDATQNLERNIIQQLPFASFLTGGRIPIASAKPDIGTLMSGEGNIKDSLIKPLMNVLPPVGGAQIMKTYEGARALGWSPFEKQKLPGVYDTNTKGENYLKYPIEKNGANIARGLLFGPSTFPETSQYYDNARRPLSPQQTSALEKNPNPLGTYDKLMTSRKIDTIKGKMDDVTKDKSMSKEEKAKKLQELRQRMKDAQNGR